jgi:hypothetical protein
MHGANPKQTKVSARSCLPFAPAAHATSIEKVRLAGALLLGLSLAAPTITPSHQHPKEHPNSWPKQGQIRPNQGQPRATLHQQEIADVERVSLAPAKTWRAAVK